VSTNGSADATVPPTVWLKSISRSPIRDASDELNFQPGVNIIVGVPNTGKTTWLRMIDYLFGDDGKPIEALGEEVANKYSAIKGVLVVAGQEWELERTWPGATTASRLSLNGTTVNLHAFTLRLMEALQIPVVHYPQGNPYGPRSWPELGWRSLFRHMYRRQWSWSDVADRQPESEQHACVLQFVGLAASVFSDTYGRLVKTEKQIQQLQQSREQFLSVLGEISKEIVDDTGLQVALTPDSIAAAIKRHETHIRELEGRRKDMLDQVRKAATREIRGTTPDIVEQLTAKLTDLNIAKEAATVARHRADARLKELREHRELIADELGRISRATDAGETLSDIRITHCPACDRPLDGPIHSNECYLCKRELKEPPNPEDGSRRVHFELSRLKSELREVEQLIALTDEESRQLQQQDEKVVESIRRIESELKPVRIAVAAHVPPELTLMDQETGRENEKIAQLRRVGNALQRRETLTGDIQRIQGEIAKLEAQVQATTSKISFERAGDLLSDGINTYLNAVNAISPRSWTQPGVNFIVHERGFVIRIGASNWRARLGGTLTLLFLVAYHYALLRLTHTSGCHYPGFAMIDFPAQLDGVRISDSENFVLEPFVELLKHTTQQQLIAAGSLFQGLADAYRIELTNVWA
jgi:DnaJ-domain-containing protein 1